MNFEVLNTHHFFENTQFAVDRFHWRGHIGCSKGYSQDAYRQKRIKGINSQVNEQANSGLQKIRGQLAYRLSVQTVHMEATGIIINSKKRRTRESGFKDLEGIQLWKMHNHPKVDYTKLPPLDDLQACSESSKSGLYKRSNFGRCIIIQKWIVQNFHLWMIYKDAQNHPKVDCTKDPILEDA